MPCVLAGGGPELCICPPGSPEVPVALPGPHLSVMETLLSSSMVGNGVRTGTQIQWLTNTPHVLTDLKQPSDSLEELL